MENLLLRYSAIVRRLRLKQRVLRIEEIKQIFDDIVSYLNKIPPDKRRREGMYILATISDELATLNVFRLFDYLILRNHPIFIYIARTFEMLLTKSNHSQKISMIKQEEDCFYTISYLIAQLCLYQNEPVELFYGKVSSDIFPVTKNPNLRDYNITKKSNKLMEKPNLKTARLPSTAPAVRPFKQGQTDITKVMKLKKFASQVHSTTNETSFNSFLSQSNQIELSITKYQNLFLTKIFFDQFICAIDDLSRSEYSTHHVKYKVIDRLIRLCSKLNIVDILLDPILKCLRSKLYSDVFLTMEPNQIRMTPKQLFFIYECPQFLIQHNFLQQETLATVLSKTLIDATKPIFDKHLLSTDIWINSNENSDRRIIMHALSCHIEFLYHLSLSSSGRQYFINNSIVIQFLYVLQKKELIDSACVDDHLFNADVAIVAYTLMLLYNLAYERQIFSMLKQTYLKDICLRLHTANNVTIQFASETLSSILNEEEINENNEPSKLKEAYINFIENVIIKSKQETKVGVARNIKIREDDTKYRFLTESFLGKLIRDIKDANTVAYSPNALRFKDVMRRIRVCFTQETNEVESLLDPIITCLTSENYIEVYKTLDLSQSKGAGKLPRNNRSLANKQLFFMRECSEFVMRHDYKRENEIRIPLCKKMLNNTRIIFEEHLPFIIGNTNHDDEYNNARIEALTFHMKLLNHFALTPSTRKEFLTTEIINQILLILEDTTLVDNTGHIAGAKIGMVGQCLVFLYNLSFDKQILSNMRSSNILDICLKMSLVDDKIIQFASQTLAVVLNSNIVDKIVQPHSLTKTYIEYMERSAKEPRQPYQGVKLNCVLKHLQRIIENDEVREDIVEEKEGILSLSKCVCVTCSDNSVPRLLTQIRKSSLDIVWKILYTEPKSGPKFKSIDQLIDELLNLSNQPSKKIQQNAKNIIWRLGDEKDFVSEQAKKVKEKEQESHGESSIVEIDDQLTTNDQWDDSVPFDVVMSFSNDLIIQSICRRVRNGLIANNIKVYMEQQGQHRLELIKKAITKRKIILVCLSLKYRMSKLCMAEVEYAFQKKCPIIAVIVETNYKAKGWLSHLVGTKNIIDFTQKNINDPTKPHNDQTKYFKEKILELCDRIEKIKPSIE